jgi:pimeloyl-ACP methyl ester carboxylesterase
MMTMNNNKKPVRGRLFFFNRVPAFWLNVVLICFIISVASSCSEDDDEPKRVVLLDATPFLSRTAGDLKSYIPLFQIDVDPANLQYDVDIFKVTYKTTYKDSEIIASGLVLLPKTSDQVGMVSFQHGTITADADAPTAQPINSTQLIFYAAMSSSGFITVVPDFIGFGESKDIFHPYYVEKATADAVIDNLRAARELAREKDVNFNQKLFLAGYSQGGYATMATHKAIEASPVEGFELIASFPASGGYDVKAMQEYFFSLDTYHEPFYITYVAMSYKTYYDWDNSSLSDFFNEPYATSIPGLFNGINNGSAINDQLTDNIGELIQADLLANIDTDVQYQYLIDAFNENSLLDWTPTIPMFMYHGDADVTVPYQNSVDSYNHFISEGASSSVVTFTTLQGADHGSGVLPYIEDFFNRLLVLK